MNIKYNQIDEVNMLFEIIKTILMTWLPHKKIRKLLSKYTHHEIRCWKIVGNKFIVADLVMHDAHYSKQSDKDLFSMLMNKQV